jgi:flagellar biosynthesis GTPase FlhF
MKTILIVLSAVLVALLACGFFFLQERTVRALEQVGIPGNFVKECIWTSFSGGYLNYPSVDRLKKIAAGERATVVREIAGFAKNYTRSEEFKQQYLQFRQGQKPERPAPPRTMAEQRRADKEEMQRQIRETQQNLKQMPAEHRPMIEQTIEMMKQQLKEIDKPDNPMYSPQMDEMNKQMYQAQLEEYTNQLAEWERDYPPSPNAMIKKWLTQFLEESRDVDYNAKLTEGPYGKMVFVNPTYESKSPHWKMCYRAGREVVLAGRAEAEQWLRELK